MALQCTPQIAIDEDELEESFVRASGPGGQNVNKLSTAVQLRFDVRRSRSLPDAVAVRLMRLAGRRLTGDGVLVITAQRFRTQERNRADARERLAAMVAEAAVPPTPRRAAPPGRRWPRRSGASTRKAAAAASSGCAAARVTTAELQRPLVRTTAVGLASGWASGCGAMPET